jgi:molecular chaperone DnaK
MVDEAEANAASDKEKSSQIDLKNQSDALTYQTRKQLTELETKIDSGDKSSIEALITELEAAVQKDDFTAMETLSENLKKKMMEIGQKVYSQEGEASPEAGSTNDEPIETDFSVEK